MKSIVSILVLGLFLLVGAASGSSGSGLRGTALLYPASPVCNPGSCTRPAANVVLRFWRSGRLVAHTRTDGKGGFRIALRPRTYRVTAMQGAVLKPARVTVVTNSYRRVTIRIDIGIR
jgi:hypothetical protein